MDQAFVEGLRRPRRRSYGIAAILAAPEKPTVHIQHITLSASGSIGSKDDPKNPRTSTINKPTPQNRAIVFRMSKPGGMEGIVFEITFAGACMAVPFV
jgi:hypothetical protein